MYMERKESRGRRGASWELPQQAGPIATELWDTCWDGTNTFKWFVLIDLCHCDTSKAFWPETQTTSTGLFPCGGDPTRINHLFQSLPAAHDHGRGLEQRWPCHQQTQRHSNRQCCCSSADSRMSAWCVRGHGDVGLYCLRGRLTKCARGWINICESRQDIWLTAGNVNHSGCTVWPSTPLGHPTGYHQGHGTHKDWMDTLSLTLMCQNLFKTNQKSCFIASAEFFTLIIF